jgi:4-hydroxyphenylpyruvate dioxygenase
MDSNKIGLDGIEFIEFTSADPKSLKKLFHDFGFSRTKIHQDKDIELYEQEDIHFLLNCESNSFADTFAKDHGPSICSMGWRVADAKLAFHLALERGAKPAKNGDYLDKEGDPLFAIYGIGDSLIYFVEKNESFYENIGFKKHPFPETVPSKGFIAIDHLTNNVFKGTMEQWANFYKNIFGFKEVRYFDIRGVKTGLTSYALQSPCGKFCIPINEASEKKSQINEYLEEYKGPGVQHLAFLTKDILKSLNSLKETNIETLDIDREYYESIFDRVPNVTEDRKEIEEKNVLVDGDEKGYLLQIFTKNLIGPIFIEIIQRKNHNSFGEGNFGALFKSIERDQMKRGVL